VDGEGDDICVWLGLAGPAERLPAKDTSVSSLTWLELFCNCLTVSSKLCTSALNPVISSFRLATVSFKIMFSSSFSRTLSSVLCERFSVWALSACEASFSTSSLFFQTEYLVSPIHLAGISSSISRATFFDVSLFVTR
jgi:hypothetical protein